MKVYMGCITDKGNYRSKNQDRAVCFQKKHKKDIFTISCVCDGIGSFAQSEIAAEMMTDGITRWFNGVADFFPRRMGEKDLTEDLEVTLKELNELVCDYRSQRRMDIGCTMSVILIINRNYYIFHVGDSRICCLKGDHIYQLTRDEVSMEESGGRMKSLLANYIGKDNQLWMNKLNGIVEEGDIFLSGSDGLFKKLKPEDVSSRKRKIRSNRGAKKVCGKLLELVLERGERDNVSCILLRVV